MNKSTQKPLMNPVTYQDPATVAFPSSDISKSPLDEIVRVGAQQMLQSAVEQEVVNFIHQHEHVVDADGKRLVVRNGSLPTRQIQTGAGALDITQPRVRDKTPDKNQRVTFSPSVLPPYLRRSKSVEELIPWLYLKGISTGDFQEALQSLLGENAPNLSPNVIVRLKSQWIEEKQAWDKRDLSDKEYVYIWADGIHVNVRLADEGSKRQCILVLMGATTDGTKELIAVVDGYRESKQSWKEMLLDLKSGGLKVAPKCAIGDGALGFWAALREVFGETCEQRCWVHKTANLLNNMPKSIQATAKANIHEIWMAATREDANKAFDLFLEKYSAKYPKSTECLKKDRDVLLTFYDFPAEHWKHLRTTNPIESTFATIRLRHRRTKGSGSREASLAMMFKLGKSAERRWRKLDGQKLITHLIEGKKFVDGVMQEAA